MANSLNKERQSEIKMSSYYVDVDMLSHLSRTVQSKEGVKTGVETLKRFVGNNIADKSRKNYASKFKRQPSQDLIDHKFSRK